MALTQISTQGIKDGTITGSDLATSFATTGDFNFTGDNANILFDKDNDNIRVFDNASIDFGQSGDLKIHHSGHVNIIDDVQSKNISIRRGGSENWVFGDATFKGPDNRKIQLGNAEDLQIYHDGTHSYVQDSGTGNLIIAGSAVNILSAAANESMIRCTENGSVELWYDNVKKFETTSAGVHVLGTLEGDNFKVSNPGNNAVLIQNPANGIIGFGANNQSNQVVITAAGDLLIPNDTGKINLGASEDLQIYHDGTNAVIDNLTGGLFIKGGTSNGITLQNRTGNESMARFIPDGAVELYYNNVKKFETSSSGVTVSGDTSTGSILKGVTRFCPSGSTTVKAMWDEGGFSGAGHFQVKDGVAFTAGDSSDLKIYHDGSHSKFENTTGDIIIRNNGKNAIKSKPDAAIELYYDNSKHFQTTANGAEVDGELMIDPDAGGTLKFTGHAAHHSKMIIGDNGGTANGNLLIEGGDGTDFLQIASNGDIDIAEAVGQSINAKVAIQHGGINPRGLFVLSSSTSYQSITMQSACSRNTTNESYRHFQCSINGVADKMRVYDNGNIENTNNSYGSLSDETLKENIVDAGSQWNDIKNIRVRKFNFKSLTDPDQKTMLGVVAQEAELVCPNLVTTKVSLQEGVEKEYKSFKYSVLYMKAIKALQEAMAKIEVLETEVAALKAS